MLDYLFLIPTYERYDMLIDLFNQIDEQCVNFKYKIVVIDDSSKDSRYTNISRPNLIYKRNEINLGKDGFYKTINQLLDFTKVENSKYYIFLADDLKLSNNFINYIDDLFNKGNEVINFFLFFDEIYTNWGLNNWVDGAFAITHDILMKLNTPISGKSDIILPSSGVWRNFSKRLNNTSSVYFPKHSLVDHLGHTESNMHEEDRRKNPVFIKNFIDNNTEWDIYREQSLPPPKSLKEKKRREKEIKILQQKENTIRKEAKHIKVNGDKNNDNFISEIQRLKKKRMI